MYAEAKANKMRKARNFQNIPNSDLFCFRLDSGFQQVSDNPFPICENIKLLSKLKLMDSLAIENVYMTVSIHDGHTRLSLSLTVTYSSLAV